MTMKPGGVAPLVEPPTSEPHHLKSNTHWVVISICMLLVNVISIEAIYTNNKVIQK